MDVAVNDRAQLAQLVLDCMVSDGLSLRKATSRHQTTAQTFLRAVAACPALSEQYDRARAAVIERYADEILELADAPVDKLDNGATDPGLVRHRQLQVDTRKWFLSKLAPKIYGDRLDVSVSDTRISISGALAAAQLRLVDVVDVQARTLPSVSTSVSSVSDEAGGRADGKGQLLRIPRTQNLFFNN
jgi:hypothetical protein